MLFSKKDKEAINKLQQATGLPEWMVVGYYQLVEMNRLTYKENKQKDD